MSTSSRIRQARAALARAGLTKNRRRINLGSRFSAGPARWIYGPIEHKLDVFRSDHAFYDRFLPLLAVVAYRSRPASSLIDVGANIGDTAALVRLAGGRQPIVCVEPSRTYFRFLRENAALFPDLFDGVTLINGFVGSRFENAQLHEQGGTAHVTEAGGSRVQAYSLAQVAEGHGDVSLVKTDTDGFDGTILAENAGWLVA